MGDLYRVRTVWTGVAGSPYYTNTWFDGTVGTVADAQDAADGIGDFLTDIGSLISSSITATIDTDVAVIDSDTNTQTGVLTITAVVRSGGSSGERLPPYTQLLLRHSTGVVIGGKRLQGRTYIPGNVEAQNSATGQPNGSFAADTAAAWATNVGAAGPTQVIFSPTYFGFGSVSATSGWNQWAVLRSRRD